VKTYLEKVLSTYGSREDKKILFINYVLSVVMVSVMTGVCQAVVPDLISSYIRGFGLILVGSLTCILFFQMKSNSDRFKKIKIGITFIVLFIMLIYALPVLIVVSVLYMFANITNKIYVLVRNPICFLVESGYHVIFGAVLIEQTVLNSDNILYLFIIYAVFLVGDKVLCGIFRWLFIRGENCYYERYRYKNEMNIIGEYVFLLVTTISILYSASEHSYVFMPILLWYSLKQIASYRSEKKNSYIKRKYLLEVLESLQEVNEVFLDVMEQEVAIADYVESKRARYYKEFVCREPFWVVSKRQMKKTFESIDRKRQTTRLN